MNKSINKNPYNILELDPNNENITKDDIKRAYKRLLLKYHPDKNPNINTTEQFKDIQIAYELLSDETRKYEYDNLSYNDKIKYYEELKTIIINKYPHINNYINYIIDKFYNKDEDEFKYDIEKFNFYSLYRHFIDNIPNILTTLPYINKSFTIKDLNISGTITSTLSDRYQNKYQKLLIKRETKSEINIYVPIIEDIYILKNEGEIDVNNNSNGDIIININVINIYNNFTKIDDDLYVELDISLYNYLYGGELTFINLDNESITLTHESLLKNNIIKFVNKGFIKNEFEERGDMIIILKIKDLDNLKDKIKNIII
jgi:DnaJ-class molecular chaperone